MNYSKIQGKYLDDESYLDAVQDKTGRLWLASQSGLFYYDNNDLNKFNSKKHPEFNSLIIWDFEYSYDEESIYIGTSMGVYQYFIDEERLDEINYSDKVKVTQLSKVEGDYYAVHENIVFKIDQKKNILKKEYELNESVIHFGLLGDEVYFATRQGLYVLTDDRKFKKVSDKTFYHFEQVNGQNYFFSSYEILYGLVSDLSSVSLLGGEDGCIGKVEDAIAIGELVWFASQFSGVCVFDPKRKTVSRYFIENKSAFKKIRSGRKFISDISGGLLFLHSEGVQYISPFMQSVVLYKSNNYQLFSLLMQKDDGRIYILSREHLLELEENGDVVQINTHDSTTKYTSSDQSFFYTSVLDESLLIEENIQSNKVENHQLLREVLFFVKVVDDGVIYNSDGELFKYDLKTKKDARLFLNLEKNNALFMLADDFESDGAVGCDFSGKFVFRNSGKLESSSAFNSELRKTGGCLGVLKLRSGNYLVNTNSEFFLYDGNALTYLRDSIAKLRQVYELDGYYLSPFDSKLDFYSLKNNQYISIDLRPYSFGHVDYFSKPVFFDNNTFALAYGNGIAHVDLDILNTPIQNQFIYLRDFKVDDEKLRLTNDINPDNYNNTANVQQLVPYEHELVKLKLTNPNYYDDVHIKFRYRLKGYKDDWQTATKEKYEVTFVSLPPDDYLFEAQASFNGGPWVANTKLRFSVETPFWLTWWAYCIYVISILAMVYGIVRLRTRTLEKRAEKLEHEISLRTEEVQQQKLTIEQLLDRKNKMFANISHEIRTPLTLIISPIKAYLSEPKGKLATTLLHSVLTNAQRLHHLVEQSLEIARLEMKGDTSLVTIELSSFAQLAVEQFHSLAESKKINMKASCSSSVCVLATKESIEILLYNLLSNAIKYTPEGGDVHLEIQVIKDDVLLTVEDSGEGIPQAERSKVFERFTRLEQHQDKEGTGLGLALVKETVESLQGEVDISRSSSLGGCLIKVTLPLATYNDNAVSAISLNGKHGSLDEMGSRPGLVTADTMTDFVEEKPASTKSNSIESGSIDLQSVDESRSVGAQESRPQVLVIEDNNELRRFIVDILEGDFHCLTAKDGLEGTAIALEQVPDLIISDLMMPHKDGIEVARTLRTDMRTSHIPIILLTAKSDIDTRHKAWQSDIDEFIAKPFEHQELIARCRNLLSIRQLLSERLKASAAVSTQGTAAEGLNASQKHLAGVPEKDRQFIHSLESYVADHYHDSQLQMPVAAAALHMSEKQLQRKVRSLLNQSFSEYLRNYRLKIAAEKLKQDHSASEVAFDVGFSSGSYFSTCFKAYFGLTPKNYIEANKN
ncbi:hybrid sensor histidine kinase/response regulator transcription factor [Pleionea mediterranea]|uniref:hybrid sensor histidine kinase/response regulator transcription factor n=1 Tax=Pleionea mediterranea TaxID=523701 RepID=UPI001474CF6C|nr:ATP-binding protein [Pleionea mediterranea]